jgi:hypothetical protein
VRLLSRARQTVWSAGVLLYKALAGGTAQGAMAGDAIACAASGLAWAPPRLPASADPNGVFAPLMRLMLAADPDARPDCSALLQHPVVSQLSRLLAEHDARVPYQLVPTLNRAGGLRPLAPQGQPPADKSRPGAAGTCDRALLELRGVHNHVGKASIGGLRCALRLGEDRFVADPRGAHSDPL